MPPPARAARAAEEDGIGDAAAARVAVAPAGFQPAALARVDASLLELFQFEIETHGEALAQGLLLLERDPAQPELISPLMRAAHSIKGAARIVDIEPAVVLSHVMEDCFVAVGAGRTVLGAAEIDRLLRATDLLLGIGRGATDVAAWARANGEEVAAVASALAAVARGETMPTSAAPVAISTTSAPTPTPTPTPTRAPGGPEPTPIAAAPADRVVRVTVQNINQLMNLAGESLVEARRLESFTASLHKLAQRQAQVGDLLGALALALHATNADEHVHGLLAEARARAVDCRRVTVGRVAEIDTYARRAEDLTGRLYRAAIASRMRPFADGLHGFPRLVRDLARRLDKQVELTIVGETVGVDRDILEKLEAPLNHLLRNALDHGLESPAGRVEAGKPARGQLRLEARHWAGMLSVTVSDDGRGIDPERVRRRIVERGLVAAAVAEGFSEAEVLDYLFAPGFSTSDQVTEISGRGVGLDVVRSVVDEVGGSVRLASELGKGTAFHVQLPITLSVIRAVVVAIAGEPYAFPMMRIERIVAVPRAELRTLEGRQYFVLEGKNVGLVAGHQVLELEAPPSDDELVSVVVLSDRAHLVGVAVDRVLGEHDLVIRPLDPRLGKVADISAAAVLTDGTPLLIVDVEDMVRSIVRMLQRGQLAGVARAAATAVAARRRVLVVDDSITVREVQRQLLTNRGYHVVVAVDGMDGWHALRDADYDLVITDVDMPRMNGLELVKSIKQDPRLRATPVMIVSYRDRPEDKQRGLEAGANYYFTKSDFHDDALLQAVVDLIGAPA